MKINELFIFLKQKRRYSKNTNNAKHILRSHTRERERSDSIYWQLKNYNIQVTQHEKGPTNDNIDYLVASGPTASHSSYN